MQTKKVPYEFLIRWDRNGDLAGAQAQFRYVTVDAAGAVIGEFIGAAEPVPAAGAAGFPLSEVLSAAQIAAFAERTASVGEGG